MPATTTYTGYDPTQNAFLSALALGETGSAGTGALFEGTGGVDLSGAPTDQFGFPTWSGTGNSHAAGIFQFQPSTWDSIASTMGLSFGNVQDQDAAAWTLASQTYSAQTGGDLETDLQAGKFSQIQSALASVWPSVLGNASNPGGLSATLTSGGGASVGSAAPISAGTDANAATGGSGIIGWLTAEFSRIGLILIGSLVVLVALWYLLAQSGAVPSPTDTAKAVGKGVALAAA